MWGWIGTDYSQCVSSFISSLFGHCKWQSHICLHSSCTPCRGLKFLTELSLLDANGCYIFTRLFLYSAVLKQKKVQLVPFIQIVFRNGFGRKLCLLSFDSKACFSYIQSLLSLLMRCDDVEKVRDKVFAAKAAKGFTVRVNSLEEKFPQSWKSHYLLTPILMQSQVKFWSPQQNSVAAFSLTTEVDGDLF